MDRKIIWSRRSQNDRIEIFKFWNNHNKSNAYSKKLNELFKGAIRLISEYKKARIKIVRDYLIIYEIDAQEQLLILTIWDSRQDPEKLRSVLR